MTLALTQFCVEDAEILCKDCVDPFIMGNEDYWREWSLINIEAGPSCTAWKDGKRLFALGISLRDCGCGRTGIIWGVFSRDIIRYKKSVLRSIKLLLSIWADLLGYKWIWALSRKGFPESQRLLEHFGFERSTKETETDYFYYLRNPKWALTQL